MPSSRRSSASMDSMTLHQPPDFTNLTYLADTILKYLHNPLRIHSMFKNDASKFRLNAKGQFSTSDLIGVIEQFINTCGNAQVDEMPRIERKQLAVRVATTLVERNDLQMVQKNQLFQESKNTMVQFVDREVKIAVVGGGFAGRKLLRNLEAKLYKFSCRVKLVLVTSKDYFESAPSIPSLLRNYGNLTKIRAQYSQYLKKTEVVIQSVDKVCDNGQTLQLSDGSSITDIDYLVLATGSHYDMGLLKKEESGVVVNCADASDVFRNYKKIQDAKSISVIGGGPVGMEIAGELAVKYPEKNLSIVSSREILLERCCKSAHNNVMKFFKSYKNCRVILGSYVKMVKPSILVTDEGPLEADVVMACIGFTPTTQYLRDSDWLEKGAINERGQVKVNLNFQVEGFPSVFAIGDICDINEEKLAQVAERHADALAKNLINIETGHKMQEYHPKTRPIFVSLGPKHSLFIHGEIVIYEGILMALVKHLIEYKMMR